MSDATFYACPQCPKKYKRREHLYRHAASHSAVRPHRCGLCNQSYQRADVLRRHSLTCQGKVERGATNRRACDLCAKQKKACSAGQPCERCRGKEVECCYSFESDAPPGAGTPDFGIQPMAIANTQSLVGADGPATVVFGDTPLFDYLGNYTSVSDMLEGSTNNQDWLDFVSLAAGNFQIHPDNNLDNYRFHFLDNFTRRSGLVDSFDCGTYDQRVQVVERFEETDIPCDALLPDPLSIQTHQILLNIKEVVTVKPRNSVVELEWSTVLEQTYMQFFSPRNIRKFLALYWHIWHPNVNFVHRPTFDPAKAKSILVAAMALIGASVSPNEADNEQAKIWFNCVEEMIFTDDDFCNDSMDGQTTPGLEPSANMSKIQALQAAYMMARDFGIMSARHPDSLYENFDWRGFAAREQLIRIFLWIYLLDHAFVIFNNLPPRMQCFADLGPLNLFAVVSAFHALIFQHQNSFGGNDQLQAVYNALSNWKSVWEKYSDEFSFSHPHVMIDKHNVAPDDLWRRVGFMRHSPEYWLLAKLLVDRLSSPMITLPSSSDEPILTRYDQTSMLQVNDLITGFQNVHIH
ncbi:uncharacterized protein FIESC28_07294 [Fusarium coffeatum]|uniref:C2H2-type domain-containing protein n=1 Tax=Fusarium coffeatum TaxID=231269 RepID=A0A366RET6_9HYPO|nr:uncharacterized protein FIESC28_07294 [Fusarium coffeatum]RBR15653.1 hypothetical protein FIESC28_07294 [Fusarium coffeatum]